ncbi:GntR family transcriptional regulator [Streptomyces sp. TRM68367]|uniref:GntR family transcriptional regulator n=1 Tax=Streptomyces sp. TRM68367 TaxID=2758415 RepID=UPI00165BC2E4|nr:GntR family transcriptional regulator [Streptomyces sp. TRM68367]MBC9727742.1 GntR family transcriptional regulator [Streptomyces sp. TRM68367]
MSEYAAQAAGPRPVSTQTRRDAVVDELRRAIMAGELKAGQRVREVHIAQQLGVSRPTLREAIYQLIHEGLLEQQPYRGVVVTSIDEKFIVDTAAVRVALETLAAKALADDSDGSRRAKLEAAWQEYRAAHRVQDAARLHQAHIALHRTIWDASDNVMLKRIWPTVEAQINLAITVDESTRSDPDRALHVHERLIDAILGGDPRTIEAEVERHTRASADELIEMIGQRGAEGSEA